MKTIKGILGSILILFIFITIMAIANNPMKKDSDFGEEPIKTNIMEAFTTLGMDISKINRIGRDKDWSTGPRYKILYDKNTFYYVYAYEDGQIVSIRDEQMNFIYSNDNIK